MRPLPSTPRLRPFALGVAVALTALAAPALTATASASPTASPGDPGDVVVTRVGTGSGTLSSAATPVFLDEYSPSGQLVRTTPLPTAASGGGAPLTLSGSASSEGALSRSADGRYLTLAGYAAAPGTASVASTAASAVHRVVARVDGSGAVDTSTQLTDAASGNNVRGAATDDGTRFWTTGGAGGTRFSLLGGTTSTQLAASPTNVRVPVVAGGQLYVTSGSGTSTGVSTVGTGLPTSAEAPTTLLPGTTTTTTASPYGLVLLDLDPSVPGVDTAYVADDSAGLVKLAFDGSGWRRTGAYAGAVRGLTGSVGADGRSAILWATTTSSSGNTLEQLTDTAGPGAAPAVVVGTTVSAGTNQVFRGVALAPTAPASAPQITNEPQDTVVQSGQPATFTVTATGTGLACQWYAGQSGDTSAPVDGATTSSLTTGPLTSTSSFWVRVSGTGGSVDSTTATATVTSVPPSDTAPTISPSPALDEIALTVGDTLPATRVVTVGDAETPDGLTTTVTSSDPSVVTGDTTGSGSTRTVVPTPVGVGHATLTITVSDGQLTASTTLAVSVSAATPAGFLNHYGASDASTAVDLGDGAMVVGDDETNTLRVYDRTRSAYPSSTLDLRAAGLVLPDPDLTREIDLEASARDGSTIYWLGSQGQNSSAKTRLNRQVLFSTTVSGTGAAATLTVGGSTQTLRRDLLAWDDGRGAPLGLSAAAQRAPEGDGTTASGLNLEGAEIGRDGSLLLGLRGPVTSDGKAIVVPVTNPAALVAGNPSTATAQFGEPLLWDLGGRGIREIRRNSTGDYLVIAGPSGSGTGAAGEFRLYSWDGDPTHPPLLRGGSLDAFAPYGKPEGIVSVPSPLTASSTVQVVADSGDTAWYGDGTAAKDLPLPERKAVSAPVTVGDPPACSAVPTPIGTVQGTGDVTPLAGQTVTVRGTVVADDEGPSPKLRGFSVQDSGDGDPRTSDGIFVFDNGQDLVSDGDVVQVTGVAGEYQGQTQLAGTWASPLVVQRCGSGDVIPTDITLPRTNAGDLEPYENMLVRVHQTLTVTETYQLGRFGQVVLSGGGRLYQPTQVLPSTDQAGVQALQASNLLDQLTLDDDTQQQNPDPIAFGRGGQPLSATNTLRGGDTVTDPVGVLDYTWAGNSASGNAYRLRPLEALHGQATFDPTNPRPTSPPDVGTGGTKVASANLLNFFNQFSGCTGGVGGAALDCRGATSTTEYQRQLAKEVASLTFLGADVIGVMEMENNGYGAGSAEQALVDALNASGNGTWAFVDPDAATGTVNAAGTDAIKAGLLYRSDRVSPVPGTTRTDATATDSSGADLFERHPVAQTFTTLGTATTTAGARFTVVANHFKSKGSCPASGPDTDQGDGQSCWNARRTAQAAELARWVHDTVVPAAGDPDVLLVGDFNSYAGEDPLRVLTDAGYVNEIVSREGPTSYSYDFSGQWGSLDHALASASLDPQVTGAGDAHHNADEPSVLDYTTDFKDASQVSSLYAPDRFRTSDHDPLMVGLGLGVAPTITGTPPSGRVGTPYSYAFTVTSGGTAAVTQGALPAGLSLSSAGVLTGTPTAAGDSTATITVTNPYGSGSTAVTIHVDAASTRQASTVVVRGLAGPVALGLPVTATATVIGPGGAPANGGSVQFFVDGTAVGAKVTVSSGSASLSLPALSAGRHVLKGSFSGTPALLPGTGTVNQDVEYVVRILRPARSAGVAAGQPVALLAELTDVNGTPIPDAEAQALVAGTPCRVRFSIGGAQSLAPSCAHYDASLDAFSLTWTPGAAKGSVTLSVAVSYPRIPGTQVVRVPFRVV